jgi:hypothetical protein
MGAHVLLDERRHPREQQRTPLQPSVHVQLHCLSAGRPVLARLNAQPPVRGLHRRPRRRKQGLASLFAAAAAAAASLLRRPPLLHPAVLCAVKRGPGSYYRGCAHRCSGLQVFEVFESILTFFFGGHVVYLSFSGSHGSGLFKFSPTWPVVIPLKLVYTPGPVDDNVTAPICSQSQSQSSS